MAVKSIDPPGILQLLSSSSPPSSSSFIHCTCTCLPRKSHYYTNCCREESLLPRRQRVVVISQAWVITTAGHREVSEREREQWTQDLRRRNGCCTAKRATFWDSFDGFNHHQPAMGAIIIVVIFFSPTQKSGWIFHRKVVNGRWYLFWKKTIEPVFPRVATDLSCHTVEKRRKNNIIILCATLKRRAFFAWLSVILGNTSRTSKINKVEYLVVLRHHQANFVLTDRTHHHHSTSLALKWQKGWWNDWNSSFSSSRSEAKSLTLSLFSPLTLVTHTAKVECFCWQKTCWCCCWCCGYVVERSGNKRMHNSYLFISMMIISFEQWAHTPHTSTHTYTHSSGSEGKTELNNELN